MIPPRHTPDAALRIRARMYRSRYPTLRTVRITGDGSVWVDGLRRAVRYTHETWTIEYGRMFDGEPCTWSLAQLSRLADAMERKGAKRT